MDCNCNLRSHKSVSPYVVLIQTLYNVSWEYRDLLDFATHMLNPFWFYRDHVDTFVNESIATVSTTQSNGKIHHKHASVIPTLVLYALLQQMLSIELFFKHLLNIFNVYLSRMVEILFGFMIMTRIVSHVAHSKHGNACCLGCKNSRNGIRFLFQATEIIAPTKVKFYKSYKYRYRRFYRQRRG